MASEPLYLPIDDISPSSFMEKHVLTTSEGIVRFAAGKNVVLTVEGGEGSENRERDSSRVHSHTLSEYKWASEEGYYGRLLAVHGSLIAYRLFNDNTGESVRVLEKETRNRHLIKGFMYPTADLQWASHTPLLAVLDCNANLYVYHVDSNCVVTKYLNVMRPPDAVPLGAVPRLSWCPFIPESEEPHELVHMVAVYFNTTVELITLNAIKNELENEEEVTIDRLAEFPESLIRLPEEHITNEVRVVCMSPDATAVAVALDTNDAKYGSGMVSFFIIGAEGARFAHEWKPSSPWPIYDLIFLDNIDLTSETPEQFWKYAVVANEEGHRLELYESEGWECIGKLRFESADRLSKFSVSVDPSAHFLFLADYDAANVYCIELVYAAGVPHFAACTQISFCHPLVYVVPYSITSDDLTRDVSLYDEEPSSPGVVAWLIALTQRSLLQLQFDLDIAKVSSPIKEETDGKLLTIEDLNNSAKSREEETMENISRQLEKESEVVDAVHSKLEKLLLNMERQAEDAERQRQEDQLKIETLIQQLKDEMSLRDERLLLKFGSVIGEHRVAMVEAIQNSIDTKMDCLSEKLHAFSRDQDSAERKAVNEEMMRRVRETMMSVLVPALNTLCTNLFQQLSENFRTGLDHFLVQVRDVQLETARAASSAAASASGAVDGSALIQLIESGRIRTAFQKALERKDLTALMFVCNNVDPESLCRDDQESLGNEEQTVPQSVLLCILKRLGSKLEGETDLKYRYIENSLMKLNPKHPDVAQNCKQVLIDLQTELLNFMGKDSNSSYKRQTRIILSLIANMIR